jgi:chorismate mutase/prephenate dehydratase
MGYNEDIAPLRARINDIDAQLIALFEQRMAVAEGVAAVKTEYGVPVFDAKREDIVIDRALSLLNNKDLSDETRGFMRALMDLSKKSQHKKMPVPPPQPFAPQSGTPIGYLGLPGSFSHIAATQTFGNAGALHHYDTFEAIFEAMHAGDIDYAIVPAENTETGSITAVIDLLAKYGDFIVAEKLLRVSHSLLGVPGASLEGITQVYSHPQPLAQCRAFLTAHPKMQTYPSLSTAQAAQKVSALGDKSVACIASQQSAAIYGLDVICADIENNDTNFTRFVIIARQPRTDAPCNKSSIVFTVAHRPGSLCRVLGAFSDSDINILKLESRPIKDRPFEYMFHLDFEGSAAEPHIAQAIENIQKDLTGYIYLGSYPRERMDF